MNIFITPFYINSPVCVQQLAVFGYGLACKIIREGKQFKRMIDELEKSQWYSYQELRELQAEKLRAIILHAYENVPYYNRLFKELHLTPGDIKDPKDLYKIPVISKKDVMANPEDFLARNVNKRFIRAVFTSGTTGTPFKIYRDICSINFENAIIRRQYRWAGFGDRARKAILRSTLAVNAGIKDPPFWRNDFFQRSLIMSAYHLSKASIRQYAEELSRYKPDAMETVPSAGYLFSRLLDSENIAINTKLIFTSSEMLMDYQRSSMEHRLNARIFDHYGQAERVCAAGTCERRSYHIYPEYGIMELLPFKTDNGQGLEVVGTSLNNFAMPLLRYRTGDIARLSSRTCQCGRNFQVIDNIEGRLTDKAFIASDGRKISLLTAMLSVDVKGLIETQFVQKKPGCLILKMVTDSQYNTIEEARLLKSIKNYIGSDAFITIEKVRSLSRKGNEKFRQFISEL